MIYGYSERGVFNSIIYYLDANPNLIGGFLKELGINGFSDETHSFIFLNEQSFSDFGDCDLTIIAKENVTNEKTVIFVEGKVKTYKRKYVLETESKKILRAIEGKNKFTGSNIFVQLYYKYLLQKIINTKVQDTSNMTLKDIFKKKSRKKDVDFEERSIGKHGIVHKGIDHIRDAKYYYVAILPDINATSKIFKDKFTEFNERLKEYEQFEEKELENVRCVYWGKIEEFFKSIDPECNVIKNFEYNKTEKNNQIY